MGIFLNIDVKKTDNPQRTNIQTWVTLCSRIPKNCGFSPGAADSDSIRRELTCVIERTVAATNHGRPKIEQIAISTESTKRSRW